jgi:short-subunit dehydrogenase
LKALAKRLEALGAEKVYYEQCDMGQRDDIQMFSGHIMDFFGQIDILVNNAGLFVPGKITEEAEGSLERMMEVNVFSTYHLTRDLFQVIKASKRPHIFNMCSTASITAYENGGSYCISKFALLGLTKVLRAELRNSHVKVTAVLPGPTYTPSWQGSGLPEERFIRAAEIADLVYATYSLPGNAVVEELLVRPQLGDI